MYEFVYHLMLQHQYTLSPLPSVLCSISAKHHQMIQLLILLILHLPAYHLQVVSECCRIVIVRSEGPARDYQPSRLGVYKRVSGRLNNRPVYKHVLAESFLFFWDYDGESRWVAGDTPTKGTHGIEAGKDGQGPCVDQLGPTSLKVYNKQENIFF